MKMVDVVDVVTTGTLVPGGVIFEKRTEAGVLSVTGRMVVDLVKRLDKKVMTLNQELDSTRSEVGNLSSDLAKAQGESKAFKAEAEALKASVETMRDELKAAQASRVEAETPPAGTDGAGSLGKHLPEVGAVPGPGSRVYILLGQPPSDVQGVTTETVNFDDGKPAVRISLGSCDLVLELRPDHSVERHDLVGYRECLAWSSVSHADARTWLSRISGETGADSFATAT